MYFALWKVFFIFLHLPIMIINYNGDEFLVSYLEPDTTVPLRKDLDHFISKLKKTFYYNTNKPNYTDANICIGTYLVTTLLQRTLIDDGSKMTLLQHKTITDLIKRGQYYISHYIYNNKHYGYRDLEYRVSVLYKDLDVFVHSINEIKAKRLRKWILSDLNMHPYVQSLDNASLEKETFISEIESMDKYNINLTASDLCLSRIMETPEPLYPNYMQPCRDDFCKHSLLNGPSIAYALSHRLLNLVLRRNARRCYLQSQEVDEELQDHLCAFMYREAVYLARKGYFARDLFLEHVALCAILGYKEFYRLHWFYKATSWMDEAGCIQENRNYLINQTSLYKSLTNSTRKRVMYSKALKKSLLEDCHSHPMTVLSVVQTHAVRYVAHFM